MRISLVLHGSGSLGSYVAGACTELLSALERNRSDSDVVIDVITGSGSGSLTAALAARALVVNRNLVPWVERCWVEAMDARNLFGGDRSGGSGAAALGELSDALIAAGAASDDEPLPMFGGELFLGFRTGSGSVDFSLTDDSLAGNVVWDDVRRAAVEASGFPPVLPTAAVGASSPAGGVPSATALGLAAKLAARASGGDEERIIVCIDPSVGVSGAGLNDIAIASSGGAGGEALLLDALIARLPEIVDRIDDPGALALGRHLGNLAERAAELESGAGQLDDEQVMDLIDASLERIEADDRLAPILARASSRSGRTRLAKLIYVLQAACRGPAAGGAASIGADTLVTVTSDEPGALACRALGSLGGFVSQEWREADFRAGRRDARTAILNTLSEWVDYEPDDEAAYDVPSAPARLDAKSEARLRTLIEAEVDRGLADIRVGGLAGLFGGWKGALKKHAADRVLSELRDEMS